MKYMAFCVGKNEDCAAVLKNAVIVFIAQIYKICFLDSTPTCVIYVGWPEVKA
jgi:hypothetical protein